MCMFYNVIELYRFLLAVLDVCHLYQAALPQLCIINLSLSLSGRKVIFTKAATCCSTLWKYLNNPLPIAALDSTIQFIISLDNFINIFLLPSFKRSSILSNYSLPSRPAKPSVAYQVSHLEGTIDPYLKSPQANYYYPLSCLTMVEAPDDSLLMDQENASTASIAKNSTQTESDKRSGQRLKQSVTTDDLDDDYSMDAIISEPQLVCQKGERISFRFSLVKKLRVLNSTDFLPTIKKFLHCILSTPSAYFLPIRTDSPVSPLQTTAQVNELTAVGIKNFFKATRFDSSRDFHVSSSLSYQDLANHTKVANWLNLQGYYMVLCDCQTLDMVNVGFLSRVRPFLWRDNL
jgi:hypothetical protein